MLIAVCACRASMTAKMISLAKSGEAANCSLVLFCACSAECYGAGANGMHGMVLGPANSGR